MSVPAPPPRASLRAAARSALLLALTVAACAEPIDRADSGLRLPVLFRAGGTPVPTAMRWPDASWWEGFASPQLDRLMRAAMAGNLDIAAAAAQLRQADAQVRITGAALLPNVDGDASVGRSRAISRNPGTAGTAGNSFGGGLSASYEIDFWGRNRALLAAARSDALAARYAIGVTALSTQSSVANALFAVLGAQEQLEIQRGNLEVATRNLDILRQRLAVGTTTGLDVAQQETVVAQQRAGIPPLQQSAEQNSFALGTLTGVPPEEIEIPATRLDQLRVPQIAPDLPAAVLARRPDVQLAEANLQAANADVAAARAALFPTISLTGSGGVQSAALETLLRPGSTVYNLAAGLTAPIFNGGSLRAQVEAYTARQAELVANYRKAILSALQRNNELVELQRIRAEAAQRAYNIAEAQLRAGTVDLLTVLNTQTTLFSARSALADAQTARLQAAAALFTALGGGWRFDAAALPGPFPPTDGGRASIAP